MQPLSENAINIPAFLTKLWRMVNDPETNHLISWSSAGKSFVIQNQAQFWYELLPVYYKHNNMSSFVRQLNMYGFHKMSTVENGTMDIEKDEIQFFHPCFQRDKPELLKNIKRKVTGTKPISSPTQYVVKSDDLSKVLSDVKALRGKQASVDTQLSAMKQENAVLWRELAMLRQKHMKQQQIVNKLIQFLVTMVQPTARMSGLGVKRHYPLMLNENPQTKKTKKSSTTSEGPTIHELDSSEVLPEELFASEEEEEVIQTNSPQSAINNQQRTSSNLLEEVCNIDPMTADDMLFDSPELVTVDKEGNPILVGELLEDQLSPESLTDEIVSTVVDLGNNEANDADVDATAANTGTIDIETVDLGDTDIDTSTGVDVNGQKVFLNPTTQDTLLSNLINGSYNSDALNGNAKQIKKEPDTCDSPDLTVARISAGDFARLNSVTKSTHGCCSEDLDEHLEATQSDIDQFKDLLNGCNALDANTLLGLFSDEAPEFILSYNQNNEEATNKSDPLVSGSELAPYGSGILDFSQLFNDSSDPQDIQPEILEPESTINTPQVTTDVPEFPTVAKKK